MIGKMTKLSQKQSKSNKKTIKLRPELFWDVDPKTIDLEKHAQYIIERVLEFGTDKEVAWMWNYYQKSSISKTIKNSRVVSPYTKNLWQEILK